MAYESCPFDVTPYDEANLVKSPKLINLNYTNQDFWSMKSRLIGYIKEQFGDSFNDFVESDLALMLIENWAFIADTLSFKMDQIANEVFIDTVGEVDNAFRLSKLVGFNPQPPIAARSLWSANIATSLETDMVIPTPQAIEVTTEYGPKTIELFAADPSNAPIYNESIIIPAGSFITTSVVGLEGRTYVQQTFGNGSLNQYVQLVNSPVISNSIRVQVNGLEWDKVDYFTDSQPRKEFRVEYDPNYAAYVIFGNNRAGLIPPDGAEISITYRVGGGVAGNIVTGSVEIQRNFAVPGLGYRLPVAFRNYTRGEYGYAGDTITDIKRKLPAWLRLQNRIVTGTDYETFASQFITDYHGQVGKANAVLRQFGCAANVIDLYILALDGDNGLISASNELKVDLRDAVNNIKMISDLICIKDGVVIETDVTIDVTIDKFYRKFEDELRGKIDTRISNFFSLSNWDYGKTLKAVDLIKEISDIKEIRTVDVDFQTINENNSGTIVTARFFEIIRPSTILTNFVYE
jgi:hypothetical protein